MASVQRHVHHPPRSGHESLDEKKKDSNPPPRTAASDADGKAKKKNILW
jgi:hypothetical protein